MDDQVSEWARLLAARRAQVEGVCEVCGTPFTGTRKKRYCSHNCAQKAYLQRKGALPDRTQAARPEMSQVKADKEVMI